MALDSPHLLPTPISHPPAPLTSLMWGAWVLKAAPTKDLDCFLIRHAGAVPRDVLQTFFLKFPLFGWDRFLILRTTLFLFNSLPRLFFSFFRD